MSKRIGFTEMYSPSGVPSLQDALLQGALLHGSTDLHLESLLHFYGNARANALLFITKRTRGRRIVVEPANQADPLARRQAGGWWAAPPRYTPDENTGFASVGDAPHLLHPLFIAAILTAAALERPELSARMLTQLSIPSVRFETHAEVRRSMTLNGMRMTTEYMQNGSQRVLELVRNRMLLGQSDVVHDIIVYVMRQIGDLRTEDTELRCVRADSIAAYLGLEVARTRELFAPDRLVPARIAAAIAEGAAGPVKRALNVPELIDSQIKLLQPELRELRDREGVLLWLLDEMVMPLRMPETAEMAQSAHDGSLT